MSSAGVVAPGDALQELPASGVVKISSSVCREGGLLRSLQPGKPKLKGDQVAVLTSKCRYTPVVMDRVIGIVKGGGADEYRVDIAAHTQALLPTLAFENATKRNRPRLLPGDVVYARIEACSLDMDPALSCVDAHGKASGLGKLSGGYVFTTTTSHARKLVQKPGELNLLGSVFEFDLAVGLNGRVWVTSKVAAHTAAIVEVLLECERLDVAQDVRAAGSRVLTRRGISVASTLMEE